MFDERGGQPERTPADQERLERARNLAAGILEGLAKNPPNDTAQPRPEGAAANPNGQLARVYSFPTGEEIKPIKLPRKPPNLWAHLGAHCIQDPGSPVL